MLRVQQHWVQCLREGREPETSGADSLKTYGLVFSAYTSARTGDACSRVPAESGQASRLSHAANCNAGIADRRFTSAVKGR